MEMKMEKIIEEVKDKEKDVMTIATDVSQRVSNMENNAIQFQHKSLLPIVGFNARLSSTKTVNTGNKVVYDTVITNQGEGYDSVTGVFTAPHNGLYFFTAHVCNQGNKDVHYAIYQEGTLITTSTQFDNGGVYSCSSVSTIAMVNKAERVWVQSLDTSVYYVDTRRWNTFAGSLLIRQVR
ncbi:complement C1q-like protein 4 [Ruditapes philippinarum]|uniref:complement C1q-like protein 4 n=1 Tax=Ruditapes philippinarum TaxID=129788 RepID=UPI00295BF8E9|nr:complement C1q-like protein 4 [Ruditapes philippinarum]